jgi:hypothetical protein
MSKMAQLKVVGGRQMICFPDGAQFYLMKNARKHAKNKGFALPAVSAPRTRRNPSDKQEILQGMQAWNTAVRAGLDAGEYGDVTAEVDEVTGAEATFDSTPCIFVPQRTFMGHPATVLATLRHPVSGEYAAHVAIEGSRLLCTDADTGEAWHFSVTDFRSVARALEPWLGVL